MALGVTEDYTENTSSDSSSSSDDSDASSCTSSDIQAPPFSPLTSDITSSEDECDPLQEGLLQDTQSRQLRKRCHPSSLDYCGPSRKRLRGDMTSFSSESNSSELINGESLGTCNVIFCLSINV